MIVSRNSLVFFFASFRYIYRRYLSNEMKALLIWLRMVKTKNKPTDTKESEVRSEFSGPCGIFRKKNDRRPVQPLHKKKRYQKIMIMVLSFPEISYWSSMTISLTLCVVTSQFKSHSAEKWWSFCPWIRASLFMPLQEFQWRVFKW